MIDSHCHLADEVFAADIDQVLARARDAGVTGALCIVDAGSEAELTRAAALAARWPGLRVSVGVHPHQAGRYADRPGEAVAAVERALEMLPAAVAIGEIGLDYYYDFSPVAAQQDVFRAQVRLARARRLPVVIHARDADDAALDLLLEEGGGEVDGIFHCYTGTVEAAERILAAGYSLGFTGIVTFPRGQNVRDVLARTPLDRVLVETDSPYLAPIPHRGRRNEPALVAEVARAVADVLGRPLGEVVEATTANFARITRAAIARNPLVDNGLSR